MMARHVAFGVAGLLVFAIEVSVSGAPRIADEVGTPVTITSSHTDTVIYLAKGPVPSRSEPDLFEDVGVAPLQIKLAPGIYTVETSGPTQSTGHEVITVDRSPVTMHVRTGDAAVRTFGSILIAAGVVAIVAGIVVVASFSKGDSSFDKYQFAIPFLAGGAAGAGIGVGMTFLGSTNVASANQTNVPKGAAVQAFLRF